MGNIHPFTHSITLCPLTGAWLHNFWLFCPRPSALLGLLAFLSASCSILGNPPGQSRLVLFRTDSALQSTPCERCNSRSWRGAAVLLLLCCPVPVPSGLQGLLLPDKPACLCTRPWFPVCGRCCTGTKLQWSLFIVHSYFSALGWAFH